MQKMNFSPEEIKAVWRCCAAILHMGQIVFDPSSFDDDNAPTRSGQVKNGEVAVLVAQLLGYQDPEAFKEVLLVQKNKVGGSIIPKYLGLASCNMNRDALAKKLYDNMFNWLVIKMNRTIEPPEL